MNTFGKWCWNVYFIQIAFIDKQKLLICVQYITAVSTFIGEKCDFKLCSYLSTKMNIDSILCRKVLPKKMEIIQKTQIEKADVYVLSLHLLQYKKTMQLSLVRFVFPSSSVVLFLPSAISNMRFNSRLCTVYYVHCNTVMYKGKY